MARDDVCSLVSPYTAKPFHPKAKGWPPRPTLEPNAKTANPKGVASGAGVSSLPEMPQSLSNLVIHLIFSTKERFPYLKDPDWRAEMHQYLGGIVNKNGQSLCIGGVEDHVHLLFVLSRTTAVADLVRDLKRASSLWCKDHRQNMQDFGWQSGYAAFSVGQMEISLVKTYIQEQEKHHQKRTFQDEYRAFLQKYQIPFDERYAWD